MFKPKHIKSRQFKQSILEYTFTQFVTAKTVVVHTSIYFNAQIIFWQVKINTLQASRHFSLTLGIDAFQPMN